MPTGMTKSEEFVSHMMFQSLFFWMMPTGILYGRFYSRFIAVSILVLLDDAYRLSQDWLGPTMRRQFQSLFFWMMPTGMFGGWTFPGSKKSFNPCSSGWCLPANMHAPCQNSVPRFQSLFFWMMPTGQLKNSKKADKGWCFNPCSSGWCLPAPFKFFEHFHCLMFQSLFFWMMPTGSPYG